MDNSDRAYQRRNHVLSESSSRLRNLVRGGSGEDDDLETNSPPEPNSSYRSPARSSSMTKGAHVAEGEEVVEEGDPSRVRFVGYLQLHLYVLAFVLGAFVCHHRHHQQHSAHYPRMLLNMFAYLKKRRAHVLAEHGFNLWDKVPTEKRKKLVKYMSYGTVLVNLYPVFTTPMKPKKQDGRAPAHVENQNTVNQKFIKLGTSFVRLFSAALLCGLLGYDVAFNLPLLKAMLKRN